MRIMHRTFDSDDEQKEYPWLHERYKKRQQRTLLLGKEAIDRLKKANKKITYNSIAEETKKIDEGGKGIHPNSIKRNPDLYEYYKEHSITYTQNKVLVERKRPYKSKIKSRGFEDIKPNRNKTDVRKRYNKLKKDELIERLMEAEEYIAQHNQRWLADQFNNVDFE